MNVNSLEVEKRCHIYMLAFIDKLETERPSLNFPNEFNEYCYSVYIPLNFYHKLCLSFNPYMTHIVYDNVSTNIDKPIIVETLLYKNEDKPIIVETLLYKNGDFYNKLNWGYTDHKIWQGEPTLENIKAILNEIDRLNGLIDSEAEEKKIICSKAITNIE